MIVLLRPILLVTRLASRTPRARRRGSQKSLVSDVPIANALVSDGAVGPMLLPIMLYHTPTPGNPGTPLANRL